MRADSYQSLRLCRRLSLGLGLGLGLRERLLLRLKSAK